MRSRFRNLFAGIMTVLYMILLVVFVRDIGEAVLKSLKVCFEVMIPSLYAFMIASGFVISSNLYTVLSKPFGLVSRYIFRIPTEYFSVFLIGSIGGYPVGAKLLSELCNNGKIDRETAEQMLSYCYLAGPAFICGIAGIKLFSSVKIGLIIFAAIICSNIIIAAISGFGRPVPPKTKTALKLDFSAEKLISSVYGGAKGMLSICAIIVFFSTIICMLDKSGSLTFISQKIADITGLNYSDANAAIRSVIEISNISFLSHGNRSLIPLAASLLSFGGICVLMQVRSFLNERLSAKRFYFFRILAIFISYFLCKLFVEVFEPEYILSYSPAETAIRQSSPIPTLFLLIMTILLLSNISIEKKKKV